MILYYDAFNFNKAAQNEVTFVLINAFDYRVFERSFMVLIDAFDYGVV